MERKKERKEKFQDKTEKTAPNKNKTRLNLGKPSKAHEKPVNTKETLYEAQLSPLKPSTIQKSH